MKLLVHDAPLSSSSRRVPYTARRVMWEGSGTRPGGRNRGDGSTLWGRVMEVIAGIGEGEG